MDNVCGMEIKNMKCRKDIFTFFTWRELYFFKMYIQQLKLRRYHDRLCIAEVAPSVSLYVRINPVLMGRHTAVDTGEALL